MKRGVTIFLLLFLAATATPSHGKQASKTTGQPMKKYVTEQATFVLYLPEGWKASEGDQGNFKTLFISDPRGLYGVAMFYGVSPTGGDVVALASLFANRIRNQFPDLALPKVMASPDQKRVVFDGVYTDAQKRRREFRCWVSGGDGNFTYSSIEVPEGQLTGSKPLLLTILSNVRIMKGAFQVRSASAKIPMVQARLYDGSATFQIPQDWKYQSFGTGYFIAKDADGVSTFMVAGAEAVTPQLGVRNAPGLVVSSYLAPHQALQFFAGRQGLLTNMQFLQVIPRQDLSQQIGQVYTSGPVTAEEFLYSFISQGHKCKGYSFGISFGSRLNTNWRLWHMTVAAPADQFEAFAPNFAIMCQSYKINDKFAQDYIARGMVRLRQMQQETARMVSRNAQEIRQMMQAAYDERQRSMDYIDYQRTNYIRGNSDWISTMEGGTIYQSDRWGTKNTATGEYYEGQAYNYFNFTGKNPKYNEQMQEINSRALYEQYKKGIP
ncbi:MAG: hypothetical protein A2156_02400 [Deltaproteobacteria bacterium RBG_16_48_10]|nr:MAG: hypothetical protein A2156_02400 [Deltaproteobacteria bacterium RBG_16_48_10]